MQLMYSIPPSQSNAHLAPLAHISTQSLLMRKKLVATDFCLMPDGDILTVLYQISMP